MNWSWLGIWNIGKRTPGNCVTTLASFDLPLSAIQCLVSAGFHNFCARRRNHPRKRRRTFLRLACRQRAPLNLPDCRHSSRPVVAVGVLRVLPVSQNLDI